MLNLPDIGRGVGRVNRVGCPGSGISSCRVARVTRGRRLHFAIQGEVAARKGAVKTLHGHGVHTRLERVLCAEKQNVGPGRLLVVDRATRCRPRWIRSPDSPVGEITLVHAHPGHFLAVDPDDRTVIVIDADLEPGGNGPRQVEFLAQEDARVVVPHVVQNRGVVSVPVTEPRRPGHPGLVFGETLQAPGVNRVGRFARALTVAPRLPRFDISDLRSTRCGVAGGPPGTSQVVVETLIDEFHRGTCSPGSGGPGKPDSIVDLVHQRSVLVFQFKTLAAVAQTPGVGTKGISDPEDRTHGRGILRDHEEPVGGDLGSLRKVKINRAIDLPASQQNGRVTRIENLNELPAFGFRFVIIVDLVDHNRAAEQVSGREGLAGRCPDGAPHVDGLATEVVGGERCQTGNEKRELTGPLADRHGLIPRAGLDPTVIVTIEDRDSGSIKASVDHFPPQVGGGTAHPVCTAIHHAGRHRLCSGKTGGGRRPGRSSSIHPPGPVKVGAPGLETGNRGGGRPRLRPQQGEGIPVSLGGAAICQAIVNSHERHLSSRAGHLRTYLGAVRHDPGGGQVHQRRRLHPGLE